MDKEDWSSDFSHSDLDPEKCVCQIVFPYELGQFDIKDMDDKGYFLWSVLKKNTAYDPELGTTPNRWLINYVREDFEKNGVNDDVEHVARTWAPGHWRNSEKSYQESFDEWLEKHPEVIYIRGKARLMTYGQAAPQLSVLIARAFGRAGFVMGANYPNNPTGWHEEISVVMPDGSEFGFWADREAYVQDVTEWGWTPEQLPLYMFEGGVWKPVQLPSP